MFKKLVAIEPVSLISSAEEALHRYAREVVLFGDVPKDDAEIIRRIGDADAVLLSYTSRIGQAVIDACPAIRYIGMCCSLYSEASANVDIAYARQKNIRVLGIRDYGDRGVVEYVLHELIALLHGYGMPSLRDEPIEITDVARSLGQGRSTFSRFFSRVSGQSFPAYVRSIRLSKAAGMLVNSDKAITEIAMECGFATASYLILCFRQQYNMTPAKFRKLYIRRPEN